MKKHLLAGLGSVFALWAFAAAPALANEFLYEEQPKVKLVPVGTNFVAENVGKTELKAGAVTIKCNESDVGGTLTKNKNTAPLETPVLEVQSVVFGGCSAAGVGKVVVRTKTTPAWKLTWNAIKNLVLTGISAEVELPGKICTVVNAGGAFNGLWVNEPNGLGLSELEFIKQPVTVGGAVGCPMGAGEETAVYKFEAEGIGDASAKWFLEE